MPVKYSQNAYLNEHSKFKNAIRKEFFKTGYLFAQKQAGKVFYGGLFRKRFY